MYKVTAFSEKIDGFAAVVAVLGIGTGCPHIQIDRIFDTERLHRADKIGIWHELLAFDQADSSVQLCQNAIAAAFG